MYFFIVNKGCASGFYFDGDNNLCVRCPSGTYQDIQAHLDVNTTCKSCSGKKLLIILKMSKNVVPKINCRTVVGLDRKVPLLLDAALCHCLLRLWIRGHGHNF